MAESFDLERFIRAQERCYEDVLEELRRGRKESHWIWYIFPQVRGLGFSRLSYEYGIASREEAEAYLAHPILGPRLIECTQLVNQVQGSSIQEIFGSLDAMKFRSSMTLFNAVSDNPVFKAVLDKYFAGRPDQSTLDRL
jgi:uncharacterized protein (DUF1810 family)